MFAGLNHQFVKRNVIRFLVNCWLQIGFANPIVDYLSTTFDTERHYFSNGVQI